MNAKELLTLAAQRLAEAKALQTAHLKDGVLPPDVAAQVNAKLGEYDALKAQAEVALRIERGEEYLAQPERPPVAGAAWRPAGPGEGAELVDSQSWRSVDVTTAAGKTLTVRYYVPERVAKNERAYASAFEAYLRRGRERLGPNDAKTLSEGVDSAGGFLVPPDYHAELIRKIAAQAVVRSLARVVNVGRDIAQWPRVNYTADDKYTSGVRMTWTGEIPASATAHRVTDPVFGLINIPVNTAMASMPISNDLIEDAAFDVIGASTDLLAEAFALGENDAFINGDGVAKPLGLLAQADTPDGPGVVNSGSASALTGDGLIALYYALAAQYRANAVFVMNSNTLKRVEQLKDSQGRYLISSLMQAGLASGEPEQIKGKPVRVDEFVPDVAANALPIIFGDFRGYLVADRVGLSVERARELYLESNLTLLVARRRVGGYCVEPWRFKVQKIAT